MQEIRSELAWDNVSNGRVSLVMLKALRGYALWNADVRSLSAPRCLTLSSGDQRV